MIDSGVMEKLGAIVGKGNVLAESEAARRHGTDATRVSPGVPYVVVLPRDAGEVAAVVGFALEEDLPVVPRGGGTGLRGGAVPVSGGIVVSTERMNQAVEIHREDLYVVAGAGVVTSDLMRQVENHNLFYPIDPASATSSTIGGNVADAAVGMHGVKYGAMRNYVLGLEMVTSEAKIVKFGAKTVKSVAGYDLTRLMVGAEGILGIVTAVTLKVLPMPEDRRVLVFGLPDGIGAAAAAQEIVAEGIGPAALEIADPATVAAATGSGEAALCQQYNAELLVEFHGTKSLCDAEASKVKEMMREHFGSKVHREAAYSQADDLWNVRRGALAALARGATTAVIMDLTLARGRMEGMVKETANISKRYQIRIAVFGHAGEGRLHAVILSDGADSEAAISEVTSACVNLGGVAVADKRIGGAETAFPRAPLSETGQEVLGSLKKAIDPKGIMNPGKLLREH